MCAGCRQQAQIANALFYLSKILLDVEMMSDVQLLVKRLLKNPWDGTVCAFHLAVIIYFNIWNDSKMTEPKHQTQRHRSNVLNAGLAVRNYTNHIQMFDMLYSQRPGAVNPPV